MATKDNLTAREMSELQGMIDRTVEAHRRFYREQDRLNEWCRKVYGVEPGDLDADLIIDGVFGGSGESAGMKASDFDRIMRNEGRP